MERTAAVHCVEVGIEGVEGAVTTAVEGAGVNRVTAAKAVVEGTKRSRRREPRIWTLSLQAWRPLQITTSLVTPSVKNWMAPSLYHGRSGILAQKTIFGAGTYLQSSTASSRR